jgi:hypothetical protein
MNCSEAKKVSIIEILQDSGHVPDRINGNNYWYRSPLRKEETASFHVDSQKNLWCDLGESMPARRGGDSIKLVKLMFNVDDSQALQIISKDRKTTQSLSFHQQKPSSQRTDINHVQQLQNNALIQYLSTRKIPIEVATRYIKEAYWPSEHNLTKEVKNYFGLAFRNDLGGYELRNKYFKGSTRPKGITTIEGNSTLNIFEGFMDFLSFHTYCKKTKSAETNIVLNSNSNLYKLFDVLVNYETINSYLDNDQSGKKAFDEIQSYRPDAINQSQIIYPGYKDFNDFLLNKPM